MQNIRQFSPVKEHKLLNKGLKFISAKNININHIHLFAIDRSAIPENIFH